MAANYLHGTETIEVTVGTRTVRVVKTSVIALVGVSPIGPVNQLTLCLGEDEASQFGFQVPGFDIPQALASMYAEGAGLVVVVNTFNYATNTANVAAEVLVATANGKTKLAFAPIRNTAGVQGVSLTQGVGNTAVDADAYSIDDYGNLTVLDFTEIPEGTVMKATYKKLDAATISDSQVVGTVTDGVRTGFKKLAECFSTYGFTPKILVSQDKSFKPVVATEMLSAANKYRAIPLFDAPLDTLPAEAITGRGPEGEVGLFNTASDRAYLLYNWVERPNPATDGVVLKPQAASFAGVMAKTDVDLGYWFSPSNKPMVGITGVERVLTFAINDADTEANLLNENGITTVVSGFGTGFRTWGNRSAAFPSLYSDEKSFISVRRTADIIHESLELAMLPFIDLPLTPAIIDSIRETGNTFVATLIQRGAVAQGSSVTYDPVKNPPTELAAGHVTFDLNFFVPTPGERITFNSFIDKNLLKTAA